LISGDLTEEHIIPGAVGGRKKTLSCKYCNNTHGSQMDSHLAQGMKALRAFEGFGSLDSFVEIAGHKVRADFAIRSGEKGDPLTIRIRGASPSAIEEIKSALSGNQVRGLKANMHLGYADGRFRLALIHAAYLTLFEVLGYRYVLSEGVRHFWTTLSPGSDDQYTTIKALTASISPLSPELPTPTCVFPITAKEFPSSPPLAYLVVLKLTTKPRYYGAILPSEHVAKDNIFEMLRVVSAELAAAPLHVAVRMPTGATSSPGLQTS